MKAAWFKECKSKKQKEAVAQTLQSNRESLDRLKEILEPMLKDTTPAAAVSYTHLTLPTICSV